MTASLKEAGWQSAGLTPGERVMLAVLDMIVVLLFVAPEVIKETTWNQIAVMRGLATGFRYNERTRPSGQDS